MLNQILYELQHTTDTVAQSGLATRLSGLVWLDGGHNGGPATNVWVTDRVVLAHLAARLPRLRLRVRVTPYQVRCLRRPWIGKEERTFSRTLTELGADFDRRLYFSEEEPSIENHFGILNTLVEEPISW